MDSQINSKTKNNLNDPLGSGQEEMKKKLMELGMYEEGMAYKEMKDTLTVVNNSKLSVEQNSFGFPSQPNSSKVLVSSQSPRLSIDNYLNKKIKNDDYNSDSTLDDQSDKLRQFSPKAEINIDLYRNKPGEKSYCYPVDTSKNSGKKFYDLTDSEESKTFESICCTEVNHYLNLLNSKKLDNDTPLKLKCSPLILQKFTKIDKISHIFNATLDQQCATLNKMAMIWHNFNTNLNNDEIQWGSPIKVETANGSLDKKPFLSLNEDQEVLELHDVEKTPNHTGLRPRLEPKIYNNLIIHDGDTDDKNNNSNINNDDDNSDDDVKPIFQKRKKISTSIQKPPIKKRSTVRTKKKQSQEAGTGGKNHFISKNSINSKMPFNPRKRTAKSPTPEYPELSNSQKNTVLNSSSGLLNSTEVTLNNCQSIKRNTFSTNDKKYDMNTMTKSLSPNKIESMITDDEDEDVIPNSQEPEKYTDRLNKSSKMLRQYNFYEDKKRKETEQWQKLCIKKREYANKDRLQRRIEEEKLLSLKLEEQEKKEQDHKNKYFNIRTRSNKWLSTRNELNTEGIQSKHSIAVDSDHTSLMVEKEVHFNEDDSTSYPNKGVQCPLCNKYFTPNKIESHADECASMSDNIQQQSSQSKENMEIRKNSSPALLICQNCKNFCTNDSKAFEQHCSYECEENFSDQGIMNDINVTVSVVQPTLSTSHQLSRKRKR